MPNEIGGTLMLAQFPVHTTLPTKDLDRARQFYEGVLGLIPSYTSAVNVVYKVGECTSFEVYPTSAAGTAQNTMMGWSVRDLDGVVADLRRRGVVFEEYDFPGLKTVNGIAQMGTDRAAWFKDPDGNILAVAEHH